MTVLTVELMGGLGNQLFQICALIATALKNGQPFKIQNLKTLTHGTTRSTYWDTMLCSLKPFLCDSSLLNFPIYREPAFTYSDIPHFTGDTKLWGYFQSEKYFSEHKAIIWQLLDFDNKIQSAKQKYSTYYTGGSVTSIHFRITGYKEISDHHPVCTKEYYAEAISRINTERPEHMTYMIFCQPEDRDTVTEMITSLGLDNVVYIPDTVQDWEQLLLMASCNAHIIANSTFSWWGAYLANSSTVIYPRTWFGSAAQTSSADLPLCSWTCL